MTADERQRWESRYERTAFRSPEDPSPILGATLDSVEPGRALDIATGLGRNARLLAHHGWTVDAIDISRTALERARSRSAREEGSDSSSINWILADVDTYCFRPWRYDLITISFFDARARLDSILEALAPGGVLVYEHYLHSSDDGRDCDSSDTDRKSGPSDQYRFAPNELLEACSPLRIRFYDERPIRGERRVVLVGERPESSKS
ncbi:class I SAM-dependent methyltransferase [Halobacteria archaeon AArc-curdl1]|uniref:Class I SAM-dependent methyltransferase n=1 Tax=Natronosalvus hydrolyticus TaxID=2979988 RepID=A0AAP2Z801_9EURY|nr:class I SAM-dependent methyltransferase [Halobacteria archaeon AArc-curdl1]